MLSTLQPGNAEPLNACASFIGKIALSAMMGFPMLSHGQTSAGSFGTASPWVDPWKSYGECVTTEGFLSGVSATVSPAPGEDVGPAIAALARAGVKHVRLEVPWGWLNYGDEQVEPDRAQAVRAAIGAFARHGIRPLILLNAHEGLPCPLEYFGRKLVRPAKKGDRELQVDDPKDLKAMETGLCELTRYWASEIVVTAVRQEKEVVGKETRTKTFLTLSKPMPMDWPAWDWKKKDNDPTQPGKIVRMCKMKYQPLAGPDDPESKRTLEGWKRYVKTVGTLVRQTQEAAGEKGGFDLEIWNELSFGDSFLDRNRYYSEPKWQVKNTDVWKAVIDATLAAVAEEPTAFAGSRISNGFAATIPWPAASTMPAGITALSKHPYIPGRRKDYPKDAPRTATWLDASGAMDEHRWWPTFTASFPEYYATSLPVEHILRDAGPLEWPIYNTAHGRWTRTVEGKVSPCPVWITELGVSPKAMGLSLAAGSREEWDLKTKWALRGLCLYLTKGVERVYLFPGGGLPHEDMDLLSGKDLPPREVPKASEAPDPKATSADGQSTAAAAGESAKPTEPAQPPPPPPPLVKRELKPSPALDTLGRVTALMRQESDNGKACDGLPSTMHGEPVREFETIRSVKVEDSHGHWQFQGDGTAGHPTLWDRECVTWLPVRAARDKWVVWTYVMTRDLSKPLPEEKFTLTLERGTVNTVGELKAPHGKLPKGVRLFDPLTEKMEARAMDIKDAGGGKFSLEVPLTDAPRAVVVEW